MTAPHLRVCPLDIFTRASLTGNPPAVFTDARGLTDDEMQALAREMNLSERRPRQRPTAHPPMASLKKGADPRT
jgi:trans-2,3-dihydro-3-hydroxyanthranilate isomerase